VLRHRLISGLVIFVLLLVVTNFLPPLAVWLLLTAVCCFAQFEFYDMLNVPGIMVFRRVGVLCGACLVTSTFLSLGPAHERWAEAYTWENLVLAASLIAIFIRQFPQKNNDQPLMTISCTLLGILYVPYLFNYFTRLAFAWGSSHEMLRVGLTGRLLILYLVVVVKCTDIGAYTVGMLIGRHKLIPRISPGKTWEGFFGGLAFAVAGSFIFYACTGGQLGVLTFHRWDAAILAIVLALAGVAGDLFESLLKRASGIKDSGRVIPGMGGMLDVLDSLLFGAPILFFYCKLFIA
jgi:phosphatidate cytidylyltransferase